MTRRLAAAALLLGAAGCSFAHDWHGAPVDPPAPAPALQLRTAGGAPFDLARERGRVVLVFFGYTRCPDVCPTTLADWKRTRALLGADTAGVRWVFVSVDPERDPPDSAAAYARRFDASFVGLGGTPAEIERVTSAWGIAAVPETPQADPHAAHGAAPATMVSHTPRTFVVDGEGRLRLLFAPDSRPEGIAADLRALR
jgi:protein SCO1/2